MKKEKRFFNYQMKNGFFLISIQVSYKKILSMRFRFMNKQQEIISKNHLFQGKEIKIVNIS